MYLPQAQAPSPPVRSTQTINVILFGEAGVGKSAVVNLIARGAVARVSPNAIGCTMQSTPYDVNVDGTMFRIFDTVGLNQATEVSGVNAHLEAIEHAYRLICALRDAGGVHLLLFCMRGGSRVTHMTRSNYRLFAEFLCQGRVPVAVVATCLEREPVMEEWWTRNESTIVGRYGIRSVGHACVTNLWDGDGSVYGPAKYAESQMRIREVLRGCSLPPTRGFMLETTNGVAMAATALNILVKGERQPSRKDIEKRLSKRLKMNKEDVKRILDIMTRNLQGTT